MRHCESFVRSNPDEMNFVSLPLKLTNGYVIFYMIELPLPVNINNNI